jgi:VWFA-related protein
VLALVLCGTTSAEGQKSEADSSAPIRVETDLVMIDVTVHDRAGMRPVTALRAEDFVVYEDGVQQQIANFAATDAPFNLVMVIDTSGSTREEVSVMRRSAERFLEQLRPQDRIALISFNQEVELLSDLTDSRDRIERALERIRPGRGTSLYDALQLTIRDVLRKVEGRKAIVALTDGVDSYGYNTYESIQPVIEKAGASLYFLELNTEAFTEARMMRDCLDDLHFRFSRKQLKKYYERFGDGRTLWQMAEHCQLPPSERQQISRRLYQQARTELREMAHKSGGRVYPVAEIDLLDQAYATIAAELRTHYTIGYYPTNERHDGRWRILRVDVKRDGLTAQTKPGYRAAIN